MSEMTDDLLRALIQVTGKVAIPPDQLRQLVAPKAPGEKQIQAFNLCDGTRSQADIAKATALDKGNFSRAVERWIEFGAVFRVGPDQKLLHIYPLGKE